MSRNFGGCFKNSRLEALVHFMEWEGTVDYLAVL
jgi:hypothetical protein